MIGPYHSARLIRRNAAWGLTRFGRNLEIRPCSRRATHVREHPGALRRTSEKAPRGVDRSAYSIETGVSERAWTMFHRSSRTNRQDLGGGRELFRPRRTVHSTIQIMADRSLLVTYVSAQLLSIGTHSLFPAAFQRSADRYQRPSIKRQPLAMQMPPPRCPYSMHGIYSTSP